jgi:hypothetical protein
MDFLRNNLFFIICGLLGAGGIALGVMGRQRMPEVAASLKKVEGVYQQLQGLTGTPVNLARIEAEKHRIEVVEQDRDKVLEKAKALYGYRPLVEGVFPSGAADKLREFRSKYHTAMDELLASIHSGEPATEAEIGAFRDKIADERAGGVLSPEGAGPRGETPAGVLTAAGVRENAMARAHIVAAQRVYCYAVDWKRERPPERVASLQFEEELRDRDKIEPPTPAACWRAQLGYWIQKDVIEAIGAVNDEAAAEAAQRNQPAWVGMMPVKEVVSIRLSDGYVGESGGQQSGSPPEGYDAAKPPGTPETVFSHSGSNPAYEVVQFAVKLVMDQRAIPRLVEQLCRNKFHSLLDISFQSLQLKPNAKFVGKIYGAGPVVMVVMNFETIMLGDVFRPLMPASICEEYAISCPQPEAETKEGG